MIKKLFLLAISILLITQPCFAATELDYFEYANDAAAQAAYVSNGTGDSILFSATTQTTTFVQGCNGANAEIRNAQSFTLTKATLIKGISVSFNATTGSPSGQVTYRIETDSGSLPSGSLADANATVSFTPNASAWNKQNFATSFTLAAGTYWIKLNNDDQTINNYWTIDLTGDDYSGGNWARSSDGGSWYSGASNDILFRLYTSALVDYSESTIKSQGSYSLRALATLTDSLDKTLTRTIGSPIDLSGLDEIKFDLYASRTGSNIKIGIKETETNTIYQTSTGSGGYSQTWDAPLRAYAQGFKTASSNPISKFGLRFRYDTAALQGTLTGYIYSDDGAGNPNAVLATFSNIDASTVTSSFAEYNFTGDYVPTLGTQYWLAVVWSDGTGNTASWAIDTTTPSGYADGILFWKDTTTWNPGSTYDAYFKIYQYAITEKTHSITDANTWEEVTCDISGVADANKDAIDSIIVTIVNADAANTFYIDNMYAEAGGRRVILIQ